MPSGKRESVCFETSSQVGKVSNRQSKERTSDRLKCHRDFSVKEKVFMSCDGQYSRADLLTCVRY